MDEKGSGFRKEEPDFRRKCEEAGTDMDALINLMGQHRSDMEIADELGLAPGAVANLKGHLQKKDR
ncbi:MAG: hypothetical protein AAGU12_02915 [Clostridiales bacterium]